VVDLKRLHNFSLTTTGVRELRVQLKCKQNFYAFNQKQRNRHELQFN